jgi:tripartite ATP-independent transporter DctM subunit
LSVEAITYLMLGSLFLLIILGYPIGFVLGGTATIFGLMFIGPRVIDLFMLRLHGVMSDYVLIAIPLFVFMGIVIEQSGIAGRLYDAMFVIMGKLRGGLAIATITACTIFAAATGVVGASVVTMGILALPAMLRYEYDKPLSTGAICAGGTLGILIPPSILILVYGPTAALSVGVLLLAAFLPGLLLASLYIAYIAIRCYFNPKLGPAAGDEVAKYTVWQKFMMFVTSVLPVTGLILAVLGSIFFGLAAPTEAAAMGAFAACIMAACYGKMNWHNLKEAAIRSLRTSAMVYMVLIGAGFFTAIFLRLGCGRVVQEMVMGLPLPPWGILIVMWLIIVVLGAFIDWIGVIMIAVPLFTPIAAHLGFHPVWFAMMNIVVMQTSFLTPPFAYSIFYLKGVAPPEVKLSHIYRGVVPFILLMLLGVVILSVFPGIILLLPRLAGLI